MKVAILAAVLAGCAGSDSRQIPLRTPLRAHPPTGFPSPGALYEALNARLDPCYGAQSAYAITEIWFAIQPDGSVSDIELRPTRAAWMTRGVAELEHRDPAANHDSAVDCCLLALIESLHFPEPDAITPVDVHVEFHHEPGLTIAWPRSYELCR